MAFIGIFFVFLLLPLGLLIGAVILRGAISLANKQIGPPPEPPYLVEDEDDWGDYPIAGEQPARSVGVIPVPSTGSAMLVVLVLVVVNGIVTFVFQQMVDEPPGGRPGRLRGPFDDILFSRLLSIPISFVITSGLLAALLPTSFSRSCLVTLFYFLICLAIVVALAVPVFVLRFAAFA